MLDDINVLKQKDPQDALGVAAGQHIQLSFAGEVQGARYEKVKPQHIVVAGMGGSALAAGMVKNWLELDVPLEVVRRYDLPHYVNEHTLVIASSYSGNTEETISALEDAKRRGATIAILAAGGVLADAAKENDWPCVMLPAGLQPRMSVLNSLVGLVSLLESFGICEEKLEIIAAHREFIERQTDGWLPSVSTVDNIAKQLAEKLAGKTPIIYAGSLFAPIAYKWKIGFNENAKNVAYCNELSEFNHNEFIGWSSHPVEKPFGVIDLRSSFDHEQIKKRFEVSDRLLSGMRPKAEVIQLQGESVLEQMLWASVLGDFVSIYLAILNGVDPTPVALIEKLKQELAS